MKLLKAVGAVGWLFASGALAQQAPPSEPASSEAPKPSAVEDGVRAQLGVQLGYVFETGTNDQDNKGPGARFQVLARFNDYVATGMEVAFYVGASSDYVYYGQLPGGGEDLRAVTGPLMMLSGVLRLGVDQGPVRPAVVLGTGAVAGKGSGDFYYFVGAEVAVAPGRFPVVLDARYHMPLNLTGFSSDPSYLALGLGTRF